MYLENNYILFVKKLYEYFNTFKQRPKIGNKTSYM